MKVGVLNLKALNAPECADVKEAVAISFREGKGWGRFAIDGVMQQSVMRVRCTNCETVTTLHGSNVVNRVERFGGIVNLLSTFRGTCCGARAVSVRSSGTVAAVAAPAVVTQEAIDKAVSDARGWADRFGIAVTDEMVSELEMHMFETANLDVRAAVKWLREYGE